MNVSEILFRGRCLDPIDGDWIYGDLRHWSNGKVAIVPHSDNPLNNGVSGYQVVGGSVGQFTGLFDRNGQRIFVGDIVVSHTAKKEHIWQHIARGYIVSVPGKYMLQCPDGQVDIMAIPDFEIVGNVHDKKSCFVFDK